MWLESLGGRKFILALVALTVGTVVQIKSPTGVSEAFVALLVGLTAAFGASNAFVTKKAIEAGSGEEGEAPSSVSEVPQVDLSPIEQRLAAMEQQAARIEGQAAQAVQIAAATGDVLSQVAKTAENAAKLAKAAVGVSS